MSQNPTLLDSVLIGMKAFVPENLHSLNQNIMCKPDKVKHTKQYCEISTWTPAGRGTAALKIIYAHVTLAILKTLVHVLAVL